MKKIITFIIVIGILMVGWYFISPLFINQRVDEALPVSVTPMKISKEDQKDGHVEVPKDIILGQDVTMNEEMLPSPEPLIETLGEFRGADNFHQASGKAIVISDLESQYLRFEDFDVINGPDLAVYLSKESNPIETGELGEYIKLDELKGNKGNQNYVLGDINLTEYKSIIIYCEPFHVIFGAVSYTLEPQN